MKDLNNLQLAPGRYVVAVSGGVDSMVLLKLLSGRPGIELVVAHFNHGIRPDSHQDEQLVQEAAKSYGIPFVAGYGRLGPAASEDQARQARYKFLDTMAEQHQTKQIITAHHQDDLIETAIINVLRGSGRKGLSAIKNNPKITRPLIDVPKTELLAYAKAHKLVWREDSTNSDPQYMRNYIRLQIMPRLTASQRVELLKNVDKVAKNSNELDNLIATLSHNIIKDDKIDRSKFAVLPAELSSELVALWLRQRGVSQFDRKTIDRLSTGLKTARPNTELNAGKQLNLVVETASAHFSNR